MRRPRIVLAAPASGSGKTMVTCGILKALKNRGLTVSSFKCGPDYIDPLFHEQVIGTKSGNLDLFFLEPEALTRQFCRNAQDTEISVVEGVMGYYDGLSAASMEASTYAVAQTIQAPVILVVNARGQSVSALATLKGFLEFQKNSGIRAVIFNQMSKSVFEALKPQIAQLGVLPLGYLPKSPDLVIESRHLGLVSPEEISDLSDRLDRLAQLLETTLDMEALLALADSAPELNPQPEAALPSCGPVKIAVARDEAFSFFYRDNGTLLQDLGAELSYFSPIHDKALPEGTQGILLPGGYPELFAQRLSENTAMRKAISQAIQSGMPCLAECGGFLYLHEALEDMEGKHWPMVGRIPGNAYRTHKLGRFGYVNLKAQTESSFLSPEETVKGHEFHYYESPNCGTAWTATKPVTGKTWVCMNDDQTLLCGFPHLYYRSAPQLISRYLRLCAGKDE